MLVHSLQEHVLLLQNAEEKRAVLFRDINLGTSAFCKHRGERRVLPWVQKDVRRGTICHLHSKVMSAVIIDLSLAVLSHPVGAQEIPFVTDRSKETPQGLGSKHFQFQTLDHACSQLLSSHVGKRRSESSILPDQAMNLPWLSSLHCFQRPRNNNDNGGQISRRARVTLRVPE